MLYLQAGDLSYIKHFACSTNVCPVCTSINILVFNYVFLIYPLNIPQYCQNGHLCVCVCVRARACMRHEFTSSFLFHSCVTHANCAMTVAVLQVIKGVVYIFKKHKLLVMKCDILLTLQNCVNWLKHLNADICNIGLWYFSFKCNKWLLG